MRKYSNTTDRTWHHQVDIDTGNLANGIVPKLQLRIEQLEAESLLFKRTQQERDELLRLLADIRGVLLGNQRDATYYEWLPDTVGDPFSIAGLAQARMMQLQEITNERANDKDN